MEKAQEEERCVYLLWYHNECGPEGLVATLDRSKISRLAQTMDTEGWFKRVGCPNLVADLENLLEKDLAVGIYPLMSGWGGLHLQVEEVR